MMVSNRSSVFGLLWWQWRLVLLFTVTGAVAHLAHDIPKWTWMVLPAMPVSVVGAAIGIFASFRTNHCYARWWEGRQLWGRLVNSSRHIASQAVCWLPPDLARVFVRRQIAYIHALRCNLRDQDPWTDPDVIAFTSDAEREALRSEKNVCFAMMHAQNVMLTKLCDEGALNEMRLQSLDRSIASLLDSQGGCERLKKTPFPRGYGFINDRLIEAYGCLLPFALVKELGWVTIPLNVLVCMAFALISEAGRVLEDPFSTFWNGLPLAALSRTIEVNLRQSLGEREVPPMLQPDEKGILM